MNRPRTFVSTTNSNAAFTAFAIKSDGSSLIAAQEGGSLRSYKVRGMTLMKTRKLTELRNVWMTGLVFHPTDSSLLLVSADRDPVIRLVDLKKGMFSLSPSLSLSLSLSVCLSHSLCVSLTRTVICSLPQVRYSVLIPPLVSWGHVVFALTFHPMVSMSTVVVNANLLVLVGWGKSLSLSLLSLSLSLSLSPSLSLFLSLGTNVQNAFLSLLQ
eukprot:TRINITY_DN1728_c0_g3_i3.p1 TRINITY_DN1728_c0_g3~~TRINITY_DN1728_c0_g3_i3.p1  ORF type:complete len:213 (+),score=46.03 TRINITY_DN1728_c0_g3_i3:385-1023(+)